MKKDLLSVIIPTFNRKLSIISRAIESVKKQTYPYIEILIIDDNKNNSHLSEEIKSYSKKENIIYIKQFGNCGACAARNLGVINSNGEFIAFLDDDDEWLPSKSCEQIEVLKKGYGLVFSKGVNVYTNITERITPYGNNDNFVQTPCFEDLLVKNYIGTTSQIMIRRECFFRIQGFDPKFYARQDYDFCLRISQHYKLYGINKILFKHYKHSEAQISKNVDSTLQGYKMLFKKYKIFYIKHDLAYVNICCKIAKSYLHKKMYLHWFIWCFKSIIKSPSCLNYILKKSCESKII